MATVSNDYRQMKTVPPAAASSISSRKPNAEYQPSNQTGQGKRIVDSLWDLRLDSILGDQQITEAVHQLIVALIIIALISAVLISTVLLFRCYMLYCQDFPNVRRYQMPPMGNELCLLQQPTGGLPTVPPPLVPRNRKQSERVTFRSIFDDDSPFIIKV
ncbi:hypothetical protein niasHT_012143 [Heterodera trifolii]|uniref:Uncharacterized protein n=1 Tax=Heterodera trifolii TaxID=157864 RepID=A0ABD2LAK5_9BILA